MQQFCTGFRFYDYFNHLYEKKELTYFLSFFLRLYGVTTFKATYFMIFFCTGFFFYDKYFRYPYNAMLIFLFVEDNLRPINSR